MLIAGISLSRYLGVKAPLTRVQVNQVSEMDEEAMFRTFGYCMFVQLIITFKDPTLN